MGVKDGVGNELQKGDLVIVHLDHPFVIGKVVDVRSGGIDIASAKGQKTPGIIQIACPQTIAFQPGPHAMIRVLFKLTNPENQELAEKLADAVNAGVPANVATMPSPANTTKPPVEG